MKRVLLFTLFGVMLLPFSAKAALTIPLTVTMSEVVTVTGTPRVAVDVGGQTRYAAYTSGSNTNTLTFTLTPDVGDVDLDGIAVSSPLELNGGTIKDAVGNDAALTFTPPNTSGIKVNYPSLGMDFVYDADGRYTLNGTAYNDLASFLTAAGGSFTRASIGTYFDSTGVLQTAASGVPRFDWDPITHAARGILIEESRTNLLTYSALSSTSGTGWSGSNTSFMTVNNPGSLPVGAPACLRDEVNTGQSSGFVTKSLVLSPSTVYTFSVWVYVPSNVPVGKAFLAAWYNNAGWQTILSQATVERDQWVRKTLTFTTNATYTTTIVGAGISTGTPGLQSYACLAQLEQGSFATSYIPTTSATVTRAADFLQIPVGSWFSGTAGTFWASSISTASGAGNWRRVAEVSDGTSSNRIFIGDSGGPTSTYAQVQKAGTIEAALSDGVALGAVRKQALAYKVNDIGYVLNNGALGGDASAALPAVSALNLGSSFSSAVANAYIDGWISGFKYYPVRAPNAQLQAMTQ